MLVGVAGAAAVLKSIIPASKPGAREVEVVAMDYAFQLPRELPGGRTGFRFRNTGKVAHELHIALLKPGATIEQYVQLRRDRKPTDSVVEAPVGILFALPGKLTSSRLVTDLLAGRDYAVECALRDSATAPRHVEMGMYSAIHVKGSKKTTARAPVRADTIVGTDYAFKLPQTLSPGLHTFVFRNEGKVRHEMVIALLAKGVSLERFMEVRKAGGNVRSLSDDRFGLIYARPGVTPLGALEVNLLPGREYRFICTFMDTEKSPRHFELGMFGSIKVSGEPVH